MFLSELYIKVNSLSFAFAQYKNATLVLLQMHTYWQSQSKGGKLMIGVVAANGLVFLLWRIPSLLPGMLKWFTSSPFGGKYPLFYFFLLMSITLKKAKIKFHLVKLKLL